MLQIEEIDQGLVEDLRNRARDVLLTRAIASEEQAGDGPSPDLLAMEGMDQTLAQELAARGVTTMEELAELAVGDLTDLEGVDPARAARLIMTARAPWFAEQDQT
jgi:N utilization substance protein A